MLAMSKAKFSFFFFFLNHKLCPYPLRALTPPGAWRVEEVA